MLHYAIVYYPKIDTEIVQEFREKYDPMAKVLPPHMSLVFPFADIEEDKVIANLENVAKEIKAFPIRLGGFTKSFDDYLFLIAKEGNEKIQVLHDKLYTGVLVAELRNDIPFIPHLTIGSFQDKKELYEPALLEAEAMQINISTELDSISLIQGDGTAPAKTIQTFSLA